MNKRERVEAVYKLQPADRIPFVPAIYEHKGALIGKSPSAICRSAEYLYSGLREELAIYDPDMLVIGIDVYNVEAEALGCRVVYFEDSNDCPGIAEPIVNSAADLTKLHIPEPQRDGRMPLYLGVARQLQTELGGEMILRGAVTGPYSMAAQLIGAEKFVLLTIEDPRFARQALEFCARVAAEFGRAFLKLGVEPIVFDSRATPVLASPRVVRELLLPVYREYLFPELKSAGGRFLPLVIGGDTTSIIDDLIATGATQFLADPPSNLKRWHSRTLDAGLPLRVNVDALLVNRGPVSAVRQKAVEILSECSAHPGLLLGCGVVAYDGHPEYVLAIRQVLDEFAGGLLDIDRELGRGHTRRC